jgi:LDH2 family malate/lactate/ureidoglycolate dehydrogenase
VTRVADAQRIVRYEALEDVVARIFASHGMPRVDAQRVAQCLLEADLRGVASHGVNRVPIYTRRLREKVVNPTPALTVEESTPVAVRVDGDNGMGFVVGTEAMRQAIDRARKHGVGLALASHSNHFGMAACYLLQAVEAGMAAMVLTNASPAMPVWGGRTAFLGTSPFAMAAPGGRLPLLLDMATSVAARGKIRRAARRGESIPAGWALDEHGRPTTDPGAALRGIVLPLGGPKGSGLSLMMEALAGVISGAAFGGEVRNQYSDFETPQNVGHLFLAFRVDLFMPRRDYDARIDALVERAKASPTADGFDEILMPGERESQLAATRRQRGLPVAEEDMQMLAQEASMAGVQWDPGNEPGGQRQA